MASARSNSGSNALNCGASRPSLQALVGQLANWIRANATAPRFAYQADSQLCQVSSPRPPTKTSPAAAQASPPGRRAPAAPELASASPVRGPLTETIGPPAA